MKYALGFKAFYGENQNNQHQDQFNVILDENEFVNSSNHYFTKSNVIV